MKKCLSILLAFIMVLSVIPISCVTAYAESSENCQEHLFSDWALMPFVSCGSAGTKERERRICQCCGKKEYRYTGRFIEHDWIDWVVVREATCTLYGEEYRYCNICGDEQQRFPEATGHNYEVVVVNPTCTEQGYTVYTCSCGDTYKDNFIEATGHNINSYGYCEDCIKNLSPIVTPENSLVGNDILTKVFEFIYVLVELLNNLM